jgi:hypothetical protein
MSLLLRFFHPFFVIVPNGFHFFGRSADLLCLYGLKILQNSEPILITKQGFTPDNILVGRVIPFPVPVLGFLGLTD